MYDWPIYTRLVSQSHVNSVCVGTYTPPRLEPRSLRTLRQRLTWYEGANAYKRRKSCMPSLRFSSVRRCESWFGTRMNGSSGLTNRHAETRKSTTCICGVISIHGLGTSRHQNASKPTDDDHFRHTCRFPSNLETRWSGNGRRLLF